MKNVYMKCTPRVHINHCLNINPFGKMFTLLHLIEDATATSLDESSSALMRLTSGLQWIRKKIGIVGYWARSTVLSKKSDKYGFISAFGHKLPDSGYLGFASK